MTLSNNKQIEQKLELIAKLVLSDYIESPKCGAHYMRVETNGESFIDLEKPLDVTVSQDYRLDTDPTFHFTKNQSDWVDETYERLIKDYAESRPELDLCTRELSTWSEEVLQEFEDNWLRDSYSPFERTILNFNAYYSEATDRVFFGLSILYRNAPYLPFTDREVLITKELNVEDFLKLNVKETLDFMFNSNNWN